ncbi:glycosyltransferase family 2 protein [Pararobbsia silviterrae]|uniref:Glycosyltransferase family 2 protein n=1 Tax=Pararobbsia silviterrae TaxID=1792498 RepID=A0A494Y8W0_9BURK|nr:glycosyltransferase family 2 protein [Pararobbsia silviterrae]RKP59074.1 glycosyltransferase family 2 protein [Pararobbsia silviterrae]
MENPILNTDRPLLTLSIPTYQRSGFLAATLEQLRAEIQALDAPERRARVEVVVSDNASADDTPQVVADVQAKGLPIRYIRNAENIGSDSNIAQCFNTAHGDYVLILGDDDLFVDGGLRALLDALERREWGVVCMRPYGFENDFRKEHPGGTGRDVEFDGADDFLPAIGPLLTLISSCVINKRLVGDVDAMDFRGGNLVQVHLVLRAAIAARANLLMDRYLVACKRNNSGGYDFSQVFVTNLGGILDSYTANGLGAHAIRRYETRLMVAYYPFYLFRQRLARIGDARATRDRFARRLGDRWLYRFWLAPILTLPRPLALVWGGVATAVGRAASGDLRRGIAFAWNRIRSTR